MVSLVYFVLLAAAVLVGVAGSMRDRPLLRLIRRWQRLEMIDDTTVLIAAVVLLVAWADILLLRFGLTLP